MTTINASHLMLQMGQMKQQAMNPFQAAQTENMTMQAGQNPDQVNFSDLLGSAIQQANSIQKQAGNMKKDFEMGKEGVDLVQVMVASEKSSVAFTAMLETRNRLMEAYKEVLNTHV